MIRPVFIGRKLELARLKTLYDKHMPVLAVIKGRRRIGKSRLITEFAAKHPTHTFWHFAGLAPQDGLSAQAQRDHFARQLALILKIPPMTFLDWSDAFEYLSLHILPGDLVLFDEISWMAAKNPDFIPKLKAWWDKQTTHMLLVFCGSVSTWIEKNVINSTAFFGRIHLNITLEPLSIPDSYEFLLKSGYRGSSYDTFKLLSIIGGIPWYLEQINSHLTVDENIRQLAFEKNGLLVSEFDRIFHDLFNGKGVTYKKILDALNDGSKTLAQIRELIDFAHSGTLSDLMSHLMTAGFVEKQPFWSFKTKKRLKQSLYRLSDPYTRFYLKVIEPNLDKIKQGGFNDIALSTMPGFDEHIGLQLEYLLIQNMSLLLKAIGIPAIDVVHQGPYRQTANSTQKGCQIDYLVQTQTNNLFICEFKLRRRELNMDIINEVQERITALKVPRGFATVPVLFHLSGVTPKVATSHYFYRIVDIADFLTS